MNTKYICSDCLVDKELQKYVERHSKSDNKCCECKKIKKTLELDTLVDYIKNKFLEYGYRDVSGELKESPSSEEDYSGVLTTKKLINSKLLGEITIVKEEVAKLLGHEAQWYYDCDAEDSYYEEWSDSFENLVKTYRYTLFHEQEEKKLFNKDVLEFIREFNLIKEVEAENLFYRGRSKKISDQNYETPYMKFKDLCPPEEQYAIEGRINPKGIVMFYCSDSEETICNEVYSGDVGSITIALFKSLKKLNILDLTNVPIPSIFSEEFSKYILVAKLLEGFAKYISAPVTNDLLKTEYIPSQYISEYVKFNLKTSSGESVNGIEYRSVAKESHVWESANKIITSRCKKNFVFFCSSRNFKEKLEQPEIESEFFIDTPKPDYWFEIVQSKNGDNWTSFYKI